mmetsp:Transcript_120273/g.208779  ORF Transcript_120273/g.208779 Transcript_120273/m.208779 type:complete len:86 (-) Transcript_120273:58-315(-)
MLKLVKCCSLRSTTHEEETDRRFERKTSVSTAQARALNDSELRQELLQLMSDHYRREGAEMPAAMKEATTEQLRRYWNLLSSEGA